MINLWVAKHSSFICWIVGNMPIYWHYIWFLYSKMAQIVEIFVSLMTKLTKIYFKYWSKTYKRTNRFVTYWYELWFMFIWIRVIFYLRVRNNLQLSGAHLLTVLCITIQSWWKIYITVFRLLGIKSLQFLPTPHSYDSSFTRSTRELNAWIVF